MSDNNLNLVDGKFYSFSFNGRTCAGVFIEALVEDTDEESGFYCNGKAICSLTDAQQITSLYSESDFPKAKDEVRLSDGQKRDSYIKYDEAAKGLGEVISTKADELGIHGSARDGFVLDVTNYVEGLRKGSVSR